MKLLPWSDKISLDIPSLENLPALATISASVDHKELLHDSTNVYYIYVLF